MTEGWEGWRAWTEVCWAGMGGEVVVPFLRDIVVGFRGRRMVLCCVVGFVVGLDGADRSFLGNLR